MLLKRGTTYYSRVWVPLDIRGRIGRSELKKSLRTRGRQAAKMQDRLLAAKAEEFFLRVRAGVLTDRELEVLVAELIAEFTGRVASHKRGRQDALDWLFSEESLSLPVSFDVVGSTLQSPRKPTDVTSVDAWYSEQIAACEGELATEFYSRQTRHLTRGLAKHKGLNIEFPPPDWFEEPGYQLPDEFLNFYYDAEFDDYHPPEPDTGDEKVWNSPAPTDFNRLCLAVVQAQIDAYRYEQERNKGRQNTPLQSQIAARIEEAKPKPRLSDLWEEHSRECVARGRWTPGTHRKNLTSYTTAQKILGNKELSDYSDGDATTLIERLSAKKRSVSTINYTVELLSTLWKRRALKNPKQWGVEHNPWADKQAKDNRQDNEKRLPYSTTEIEGMFKGLGRVRLIANPERFWGPLISLYTGMRLNEASQLRVADVEEVDGVWLFRIKHCPEHNQTTKNKTDRICPVHPVLKKIGLLKYVEERRSKRANMLFENVSLYDGKWKKKIGDWYNRTFEPEHVSADKEKSFHSLRHTFINWFVQNVELTFTSLSLLKSIVGHMDKGDLKVMSDSGGITQGTYSDNYSSKKQYELLRKLDYGVDISLLIRLK